MTSPSPVADIATLMAAFPPHIATAVIERITRCGDIGEGQREYEVEPISEPGVPEPAPAPAPEPSTPREPVPA